MANVVQVEYIIRDPSLPDMKKKSKRGARGQLLRPKSASVTAPKSAPSSPRPPSQPPLFNDGFIPMEIIERLNVRSRGRRGESRNSGYDGLGGGNSIMDSPQSRKRAEMLIPPNLIIPAEKFAQGLVYDVDPYGNPRPTTGTSESAAKKPLMPSRPSTAAAGSGGGQESKRQNAFGRFTPPAPVWKFSEKIDLNDLLQEHDAKINSWRCDHPPPYDNARKTPKPPVFVKDEWYQRNPRPEIDGDEFPIAHSSGNGGNNSRIGTATGNQSLTRPSSAPSTRGKVQHKVVNPLSLDIKPVEKKDYHEVYQRVREPGMLPSRHRLSSKTFGKALNYDLPLHPELKTRLDHGIHATKWNVMTIATDDEDRLFPTMNRPTVAHDDFEKAFHATRTIRGEFVETLRTVDEISNCRDYSH